MKSRLFIILLPLLFIQSCSTPQLIKASNYMHSYFGRDLKSIEGTLLGSYQADTPMINGNFLTVDLAEDNVYIEKNAFGTFYGTWSVAREGFRYYKTKYHIVIFIDSIDSPYSLHYDGSEPYQCMRTTMYYYSPNSERNSTKVTMKDRTGSPINLFNVVAYDSTNKCIDVLNARRGWDTASSIEKYDILPGTDKIGVLLDELIDCECHYNPDSGNVVIIVTPHCQDFRLRVTGRNLYFFQYDKYGVANRKTKIKLLRQDKSGKDEVSYPRKS